MRRGTGQLLAIAFGLALLLPGVAGAATDHFVDCSASYPGDGSRSAPLDTVAAVNALAALGPGDRLLLKRGTTCEGRIEVRQAAGSEAEPATVGAWGEGAKPRIVAAPGDTEALLVEDADWLTVENLDLSAPGPSGNTGESAVVRNGVRVHVAAEDRGRGLVLRDLDIHDVDGDLTKNRDGSAGVLATTGPAPARYDGLLIENSTVTDVSRSGISIYGTTDPDRPAASRPWPAASTGVVVRGNRLERVAGDGIVPRGTNRALVEGNVVRQANLAGRPLLHPDGEVCNAGIWAFQANNTVIRENVVSGMKAGGCDSTGFDLDYNQDGTVIERNLSHDNGGGFVLLCAEDQPRWGDVRFNLSVNDAATINHGPCAGHFGTLDGIRFFNNTVVATRPVATMQSVVQTQLFQPGDFRFFNNLIYATEPQNQPLPCGNRCESNLFFNLPPAGVNALTANPLLAGPLAVGGGNRTEAARGFRPRPGSPAYRAGLRLPDAGYRDFFGKLAEAEFPGTIGFDLDVKRAATPGPTPACRKATRTARKTKRKLRRARKARRQLRRRGAARWRIRKATRRVKRLKAQHRRQVRKRQQACR